MRGLVSSLLFWSLLGKDNAEAQPQPQPQPDSQCLGGMQLIFTATQMNQPDAVKECKALGATLAILRNPEEFETALEFLNSVILVPGTDPWESFTEAWLGIIDPQDLQTIDTKRFGFIDGSTDGLVVIHSPPKTYPWKSEIANEDGDIVFAGHPVANAGACVAARLGYMEGYDRGLVNADCKIRKYFLCRSKCPETTSPTSIPTFHPTSSTTNDPFEGHQPDIETGSVVEIVFVGVFIGAIGLVVGAFLYGKMKLQNPSSKDETTVDNPDGAPLQEQVSL